MPDPTTRPFGAAGRIVGRMRPAPIPTIPSPPTRPSPRRLRAGVAATAALVLLAPGCGILGGSDDEAAPSDAEVTEEIVPCDVATTGAGPVPSIDLGAVVVSALADAERVPVDGGIEIPFT